MKRLRIASSGSIEVWDDPDGPYVLVDDAQDALTKAEAKATLMGRATGYYRSCAMVGRKASHGIAEFMSAPGNIELANIAYPTGEWPELDAYRTRVWGGNAAEQNPAKRDANVRAAREKIEEERPYVPLTEGKVTKGGQNPPYDGGPQPPAPEGSGGKQQTAKAPVDAVSYRDLAAELLEAIKALRSSMPVSGRNTPENPFGQCTATLADGRKVDRYEFALRVSEKAKALLAEPEYVQGSGEPSPLLTYAQKLQKDFEAALLVPFDVPQHILGGAQPLPEKQPMDVERIKAAMQLEVELKEAEEAGYVVPMDEHTELLGCTSPKSMASWADELKNDKAAALPQPPSAKCALCGRPIATSAEEAENTRDYCTNVWKDQAVLQRIVRDRRLTPEEAALYQRVREQIEQELPELIARHHERMARDEYSTMVNCDLPKNVSEPKAGTVWTGADEREDQY